MRLFLCSIIAVLANADILSLLSGEDEVKGVEALTKSVTTLLDVSISSTASTDAGVSSLPEFLCLEWDIDSTTKKPKVNTNCKDAMMEAKTSFDDAKSAVEKQTLVALVKMLMNGQGAPSPDFEGYSPVSSFGGFPDSGPSFGGFPDSGYAAPNAGGFNGGFNGFPDSGYVVPNAGGFQFN